MHLLQWHQVVGAMGKGYWHPLSPLNSVVIMQLKYDSRSKRTVVGISDPVH
jgi:hypothetical protein